MIIIKISDIYEVRVDPYNYSLYKKPKNRKSWICLGHYQDMERVLLALSREEMKPTEEETIKEYIDRIETVENKLEKIAKNIVIEKRLRRNQLMKEEN